MTIKWNEKVIPFHLSYYAIKHFQEETKSNIKDLGSDLSQLEVLVWYAIVAGYKKEGKQLDIERADVEWILDESMDQVNSLITKSSIKEDSSKKN